MKAIEAMARPMALALAGAGLLLTSCGAANPAQGSASPRAAKHTAAASTQHSSVTSLLTTGPPQRGIDINFYDGNFGPGNTVANESPGYVNYVKGLGANWMSITFPVFVLPKAPSTVVRLGPTPSPLDVSILTKTAERAGLSVILRPLVDETAMKHSRVHWTPSNLARFFATYQRAIMPYAQMAQQDRIKVFTVGVEFDNFAASPRWNTLDAAIRRVYKGQLAFANNWDQLPFNHSYGGRNVRQDVDAYPGFNVPASATTATLTRHWTTWAHQLRAGTVMSEVGISAQDGAYVHPYIWELMNHGVPVPINYQIQVRWFAAACNAVANDHLGGIFFWAVPFGSSLTVPSRLANPGDFAASPGQTAIRGCFTKLKRVR